jgi:hypothetical protein
VTRVSLPLFIISCLILWGGSKIEAAGDPLVPVGDSPYQWVYDHIRSLQLRGHLLDLNPGARPYLREEIAQSLTELDRQRNLGRLKLTQVELSILERLKREFAPETRSLEGKKERRWSHFYGAFFQALLESSEGERPELWETLWLNAGAKFGQHFCLYGGFVFDRELAHDTTYTGKVWRGLTALTDRAGLCLSYRELRLQMGREKYVWGLSRIESLLFSSEAFPIDQGHLDLRLGPLRFSSFAASLSAEKIAAADDEREQYVNRFLSGHRIDLDIRNVLHIGLSETVVYGGPGRSLELYYLNPLVFYHLAQLNENRDDNTFFGLDLLLRPWRRTEAYAELLIDDYQVEDKFPEDKEPNHYAYLLGLAFGDPLGLNGCEIFGEYLRITNWTYNQSLSWNRYQSRGRPIGNSLGPDGDRLDVGAKFWPLSGLEVKMFYTHLRGGEGRIDSGWEEPWITSTEEYREDFPSGVVEKTDKFSIAAHYYADSRLQFELGFGLHQIHNFNNQPQESQRGLDFNLTAICSFID